MDPQQPYNPQNQQPPQPEVYNSPTLANASYGVVQPQSGGAPASGGPVRSRRGLLIAAITGGAVIIILIILAVVLTMSSSGSKEKPAVTETDTSTQALQPAKSIELEQANNSINQDMSGLNDEKDFPANSLDDKTLGL